MMEIPDSSAISESFQSKYRLLNISYKKQGVRVPVVLNSSSYSLFRDQVETAKKITVVYVDLEGLNGPPLLNKNIIPREANMTEKEKKMKNIRQQLEKKYKCLTHTDKWCIVNENGEHFKMSDRYVYNIF
jgi:hypothetical protein